MTPPPHPSRTPVHSSMRTRVTTNAAPNDAGREVVTATTILEMALVGEQLQIRFAMRESCVVLGPASDQMAQRRRMAGVRAPRSRP